MLNVVKWVTVIIITLLIVTGVWFYGGKQSGGTKTETIEIGAILALTGNQQDVGQSMMRGMQLAEEEINNSDNSNLQINISFEDSQADPKTGLTAYRKLTDINGVNIFVFAHSNVSDPLSRVANSDGNLAFNIYSSATNLTQIGDLVFRNEIKNDNETTKLVDFALTKGYKKIALLTVNTEGSQNSAQLFRAKFLAGGGKILADEKYDKSEKDFQTFLTKIKNANPDLIFLIASPKQGGQILKRAKELGINLPVISDFHIEGPELLSVAGLAAESLIYTHTTDLNSSDSMTENYVSKYVKKYNQAPDYFSAVAYDSIKILYEATKNCSNYNDMICLSNELLKTKDFLGVTGLTTIGTDRESNKTIIFKTVKNGQFVTLEQ